MISTGPELPKALRERAESSIAQLRAALDEYKNVCYANSLGAESVVLTDLIWERVPEIDIPRRIGAALAGGTTKP